MNQTELVGLDSIQSGDIICRLGDGFFSNQFRKYASKEKRFSHVGLISEENDTLFVYHAEASELTGVGKVKRELLVRFISHSKDYAFYELMVDDSLRNLVVLNVQGYWCNNTPFDLDFNSTNDSALYCTELLANCINQALELEDKIVPSIASQAGMVYALDDIYEYRLVQEKELTP